MSNENWMKNLPTPLHTVPLIYLAIPGSHDTMTYGIQKTSGIAPDASKQVRWLGKVFGPFVKKIVFNWSVTQRLDVEDQLNLGVRYLDMRVSTRSGSSDLFFVHALYAGNVQSGLERINEFLNQNRSECVVIDFQHFYKFTKESHEQLIHLIVKVFGTKLCAKPNPVTRANLRYMWSHGYQVIVIYRNDIVFQADARQLWSGSVWPTFWPDTTSLSKLIEYCNRLLLQRDKVFGFVTQCLFTPDSAFVTRHLFSNLLTSCARPCNEVTKSWIQKQIPGEKGVNVIIADFIAMEGFDFCNTVIALNYKLLDTEHVSSYEPNFEDNSQLSLRNSGTG